jgi:NNP family nitrate/nitrite transporter-like MFS transporter
MARIERWEVEDEAFWTSEGKKIARRNLWISIPNLLCGFAVWLFWSIVIVKIQDLHEGNRLLFDFKGGDGKSLSGDAYRALLYSLPAVGGLAGATLRIPNSFMIAISGGRNVVFMTSLLLLLPALGTGLALADPGTSFTTFILLATLSGIGGGAFASSMSNISFFFPKRVQGTSLGLNAGLGNLGVSVMQVLLPFVMTFGLFGALGGEPQILQRAGEGGVITSSSVWVQNAGLVWVPILAVLAVLAFLYMNNLPQHQIGSTLKACGAMLWLELLGLAGAAFGVFLLLNHWGLPEILRIFIILVVVILATLALMRWVTPKGTRDNLRHQFRIFRSKHNWIMTWLYIMTFGSFIGYSAAFPKLIKDVFGYVRVDEAGNLLAQQVAAQGAPDPLLYAWLGPLVGSLIRPVGGWLSDKFGGARVTHWDTIVMIVSAIAVGWCVHAARTSPDPQQYFAPFLILFLVLFVTTGIGNGSTFRMVPIIFEPAQAGPVLGWTSAVAAYGAFLIPTIFGIQIKAGAPELALYGFAAYYVTCLGVNWWFYARKNAEIRC